MSVKLHDSMSIKLYISQGACQVVMLCDCQIVHSQSCMSGQVVFLSNCILGQVVCQVNLYVLAKLCISQLYVESSRASSFMLSQVVCQSSNVSVILLLGHLLTHTL